MLMDNFLDVITKQIFPQLHRRVPKPATLVLVMLSMCATPHSFNPAIAKRARKQMTIISNGFRLLVPFSGCQGLILDPPTVHKYPAPR